VDTPSAADDRDALADGLVRCSPDAPALTRPKCEPA
jgi:hypothetical protein